MNETFDCILISETLNLAADVQQFLDRLLTVSRPDTRLILNFHSNLWRPWLSLGTWLGLRAPQPQSSWLSSADVRNLLQLAEWEFVQQQARLLCPVRIPLIAGFLNRWIAPLVSWLCLTIFVVRARPRVDAAPIGSACRS